MLNIWIGKNYCDSSQRILVLGESWYDELVSLPDYINGWAAGKPVDATFSRIFNSGSGSHTSRADYAERIEFWNSIAFYNFVLGSVGPTRKYRPTKSHYETAQPQLRVVLNQYKPLGVWILGTGQAEYSAPIMAELNIPYETVPHPTSYGLKAEVL